MWFKLFIRQYSFLMRDYETKELLIKCKDKIDLYAFIGYLYSTQIEEIKRIVYVYIDEKRLEDIDNQSLTKIRDARNYIKMMTQAF